MESGLHVKHWREPYDYLSIFYCNTFAVSLAFGCFAVNFDEVKYYVGHSVASIVIGFAADYFSTKLCLCALFFVSAGTAMWDFFGILTLFVGQEILNTVYICDTVPDKLKVKVLTEITGLQIFGFTFGSMSGLYLTNRLLISAFITGISAVLFCITVTCFEETIKDQRPNVSFSTEGYIYPNAKGVAIIGLLLATANICILLITEYFAEEYYYEYRFIAYCEILIVLPIALCVLCKVSENYNIITLAFSTSLCGMLTWILLFSKYFYFVSVLGVFLAIPALKICAYLLFSRTLGPSSPGKFIGFSLSLSSLFPIFLKSWIFAYTIPLILLTIAFISIHLFSSSCESHKDYIVSSYHNSTRRQSRKFKIKLKRASVLQTDF